LEELAKKQLEERRKLKESEIRQKIDENCKSDLASPLVLFFVPDKHLKYLIPDFEQTSCKEVFRTTACHESHFGIARILAYEGKFNLALEYLEKAQAVCRDRLYELWNCLIRVKVGKEKDVKCERLSFFQRIWCCSSVRRVESLAGQLERLDSIESFWGLLELSLKALEEVEKPEYYASQLKIKDEYIGYLSWSEVYLRKNASDNFLNLIQELIKRFGSRPEAYIKYFNFAFSQLKDLELAGDISSEALLRINPDINFQYYVLFCIYSAKVYFKQNKFKECFALLQKKFVEHPTYPVFLYLFGKFCTKSEDFRYNGTALSALTESLRLCDETRFGDIYYWLAKAFILARLHSDAFFYAINAGKFLDKRKVKKIAEMTSFVQEVKPNMDKIVLVENLISAEFQLVAFEKAFRICEEVQEFHKLTADILQAKCLWKIGRCDEALKKLYSVSGVSTVKMTAYFVLLDFLKQQDDLKSMKSVASEMITKCRNPQVPSYIWMKVNLIYSKILVKQRKPGKAILLLKSLAKLLPPFPFANIQYTKVLQRASSIHELTEAHSKVLNSYNAYSFSNYKNSFIETFTDCRVFSKKLIEEAEISPKKHLQRRGNRLATEKLDGSFYSKKVSFDLRHQDEKASGLQEVKSSDSSDLMLFSVCSETKFLYNIGKIAMRYGHCLQDGLCAVSDYLELLRFEKNKEKSMKFQEKAVKLYAFLVEQVKNA
jgi:tetratricopeptide (TPR) repeat protein